MISFWFEILAVTRAVINTVLYYNVWNIKKFKWRHYVWPNWRIRHFNIFALNFIWVFGFCIA